MFVRQRLPKKWWLHVARYRGSRHVSNSRCAFSTIEAGGGGGSNKHDGTKSSTSRKRPRVVVAMSGGVDSSVAAYLLQQHQQHKSQGITSDGHGAAEGSEDGLDVIGLHMSNWNALDEDPDQKSNSNNQRRRKSQKNTTNKKETIQAPPARTSNSNNAYCEASENDYNDALLVAQHLDMPLHRVSFASEYWIQVFEPFVESVSSSISPNPDVGCNTYIKFGAMKEYAMKKLQADYVATGHYAQLWHRDYASLLESESSCVSKESLGGNNNNFHEWMVERSQVLEQCVKESIAGRPEEEWILNNNDPQSNPNPIATQHQYPMLLAGADRSKDQSYFLSGVKSEAFCNVVFPLGHLTKSISTTNNNNNEERNSNEQQQQHGQQQSVRDIAHQANIPTASKRDSMGICFIGKRNFGNFVAQYLPEPAPPGNFVDVDTGEVVGRHEGAMHYTIGQGAKISGASVRYFVCGKGGDGRRGANSAASDDDKNTVFVCNSTHHPALYTDELFVDYDSFNWIGLGGAMSGISGFNHGHIPRPLLEGRSIKLLARTRHLQPLASCTVTWESQETEHTNGRGRLMVHFDNPIRAITPGQILALYAGRDGLVCLGGGPIKGRGASSLDRGVDLSMSSLHPSGHNDLPLSL